MQAPEFGKYKEFIKSNLKVILISHVIAFILLGVASYMYGYEPLKIIRNYVITSGLIFIGLKDQKERRIPNKAILTLFCIRVVLLVIELIVYPDIRLALLTSVGTGFLLAAGIFLFVYFLSRGGVGMGDVKLFAIIGMYVGSDSIFYCILLSMIASALYSVVMVLRKKVTVKDTIALGPFITIGTVLTFLIGA